MYSHQSSYLHNTVYPIGITSMWLVIGQMMFLLHYSSNALWRNEKFPFMVLIHGNNRRRIVREFAENSRWIRLRDAFFVQTADLLRGYIEKMRRRILCVKERSVFESHCCRCIAIVLKFGSLKMASNLATDLSFLNDFSILNARNVGFWNYTGFMT